MQWKTTRPEGAAAGIAGWLQRHPHPVAVGGSLFVHLLLLLLAVGGWRLRTTAPEVVEERVRIRMYLAPPSAPPSPVAPREAPQPTPDSAVATERSRKAQHALVVEQPVPVPLPVPAEDESGSDTQPVRVATSTADASPPSQAAAPLSPSLPPAPRLAGMSDPDWVGEVLARLEKFRRYPRSARMQGQQGVVYVRARLDRQGRVLSVRMRDGSGYPLLDQEALDTFRRAQSLPPPPPELPDPVELDVPVEFFLR